MQQQEFDIHTFGENFWQETVTGPEILGGKGNALVVWSRKGLPVPRGVTIPTDVCMAYHQNNLNMTVLVDAVSQVVDMIKADLKYPPLLSVRSGARVSMPGMMDTVLNVGMGPYTINGWIERLGAKAAWDCYRRFVHMYGQVVLGIPDELFHAAMKMVVKGEGVKDVRALDAEALKALTEINISIIEKRGKKIPVSLKAQLRACIEAVFKSWFCDRAIAYRKVHKIPDDWGTAVNVQMMVFGNAGDHSCSGVAFTRCPETGVPELTGEFLPNAQGEDVVSGTAEDPYSLEEMVKLFPSAYAELKKWADFLEQETRDMRDIEFTVQNGKLYVLQDRSGKRSAKAAFRIAYDLLKAGLIEVADLPQLITMDHLKSLSETFVPKSYEGTPDGTGIAAGGSVFTGRPVVARTGSAINGDCVLVAETTDPDDFAEMSQSGAILTLTGGKTCHAAVVARSMGKHCVVGSKALRVEGDKVFLGDTLVTKITLDGSTGRIWVNQDVPIEQLEQSKEIKYVLDHMDLVDGEYDQVTVRNVAQVMSRKKIRVRISDFETLAGFEAKRFTKICTAPGVETVELVGGTDPDKRTLLGGCRDTKVLVEAAAKAITAVKQAGVKVSHSCGE